MSARTRLDELARGFQHSVVLLTACHAGVFAAMGERAVSAKGLAGELGFDFRALEILLLALAAEEFLVLEGDTFRIAPEYAPFVLPGSPATQINILNHNYNCMQRWVQLETTLKTGAPPPREDSPDSAKDMRAFICGMADISRVSSVEVAKKLDFSLFRKMLDLGGGPATSSITFAQRNPNLNCVVFDLEGPLGIAKEEIEKAGLSDRITTQIGNYHEDAFGDGFDLVYISNIIHSLPPGETELILKKSRKAMVDGGTVVLKDFFMEDNRIAPQFAALFSVNMLMGTKGGKSYTRTETKEILKRCGFGDFKTIEVAAASELLVARTT
jgi:ubiquinone/menaquinone biosynthesis C-methylase UbiE